ncbi:MAG TPA: DUF6689 family protein [Acetobacteraceae bacterium]|nr:DUF6689 family protein [Acetobacteraceae bacterium]
MSGNQALAQISLPNGGGSVDADVTITFDSPVNLSADELNLTAQLVDPTDPALVSRLPFCLLACVTVDPAFPLLVTVEPLDVLWLFRSGFENDDSAAGNLEFLNTYEFEIHTAAIDCTATGTGAPCPTTAYRLFKAPVGGAFTDYTSEIVKGSVRARGRGGAFSQFLIVRDTRLSLLVELEKYLALETRILAAVLNSTLQGDLLGLLAEVQVALLVNLDTVAAIANLDALIAEIQANAGITIANRWTSDHSLVNDAGEMEGLAQTLRYTLLRLQNGN